MVPTRRRLLLALPAATLLPLHGARAQAAYPTRPIRLVVPFPAGGGTDALVRVVTPGMAARLGQPIVVDNRAGAGGNVGSDIVAKSPADGYTLLAAGLGMATNSGLYKTLPFDPVGDFVAISLLVNTPNVLVVNNDLPVRTVPELVAYLRANPGKLNFGSGGNGTSAHLCGELMAAQTKTQMVHVPYKGSALAMTDLIGGRTQIQFDSIPLVLPHVRSGRVRALGVTSATRAATAPDIPTVAEQGLPDFVVASWFGLMAPRGTPAAVVALLNKEANAAIQEQSNRPDLYLAGSTQESFARLMQTEVPRWKRLITDLGIKADE